MAEALKRWNGTEWVTVAMVNRIEVAGSAGGNAPLQGVPIGQVARQIPSIEIFSTVLYGTPISIE